MPPHGIMWIFTLVNSVIVRRFGLDETVAVWPSAASDENIQYSFPATWQVALVLSDQWYMFKSDEGRATGSRTSLLDKSLSNKATIPIKCLLLVSRSPAAVNAQILLLDFMLLKRPVNGCNFVD